GGRATADELHRQGICPRRWALGLRTELREHLPTRRRFLRQNSARDEARRHPGRAADQVRSYRQPDHRQGAWAQNIANLPRPRRRGDRIVWTTSEPGTSRQFPAQLARYAEQLTIEFEHSRGGAKMKVAIIAVLLSMVSGVPAFAATFVYVSNAEDGDIGMYTLQSDGSLHSGPRFKAEKVVMPMAVSPDKRF